MTTFSFTTGNPANLVGGGNASMTDIGGSLADIQTFLNGGNIDAGNLATSAKPVTLLGAYKTVVDKEGFFLTGGGGGLGNGTHFIGGSVALSGQSNTFEKALFGLNGTDYSVSGLTAKLRLRAVVATNSVAPTVTFTIGLYPVSASAGGASTHSITLGTVVSGSQTTAANPGASAAIEVTGSDFTIPSSGVYALGVLTSGAPASTSAGIICARLEVHHV